MSADRPLEVVEEGVHLLVRPRPVELAVLVLDVAVERGERRVDQLGHGTAILPLAGFGAIVATQSKSRAAIFLRFLKFGALAWGGPAAQIAMIKRECVDEARWTSEESFKKLLAVYQVLPGPEAHELCVYFGRLRGGKLGGLLAGLGFMLPGFVLMLALSLVYVKASLAGNLDTVFYGATAAVAGLVARALLRFAERFITGVPLAILAVAAFAL